MTALQNAFAVLAFLLVVSAIGASPATHARLFADAPRHTRAQVPPKLRGAAKTLPVTKKNNLSV
jgi:hypothetical protein